MSRIRIISTSKGEEINAQSTPSRNHCGYVSDGGHTGNWSGNVYPEDLGVMNVNVRIKRY